MIALAIIAFMAGAAGLAIDLRNAAIRLAAESETQ